MTNREMLIKSLTDDFDDPAASESNIAYHIACPHVGTAGGQHHPCDDAKVPPWKWDQLKICGPCIMAWLDEEAAE